MLHQLTGTSLKDSHEEESSQHEEHWVVHFFLEGEIDRYVSVYQIKYGSTDDSLDDKRQK